MLYRKITSKIESYLKSNSNKMLVVDGARQIGKSFIIRHIGSQMFANYIEINMELDKQKDRLFANVHSVEDFMLVLSSIAGSKMKSKEDTLVFIDEIQVYDQLLTLAKFLMQDGRFTYIASGLSWESPFGRRKVFRLEVSKLNVCILLILKNLLLQIMSGAWPLRQCGIVLPNGCHLRMLYITE